MTTRHEVVTDLMAQIARDRRRERRNLVVASITFAFVALASGYLFVRWAW